MNTATINQWCRIVGDAIGQSVQLDDRGLLAVELQSGLVCTIEFDALAEVLTFHTDIFTATPDQAAVLMSYAMDRNLYCLGSGGITLGFDRTRDVFVASTCFPISVLTEESFLILFERFISAAEANHRDFVGFDADAYDQGVLL